ncbi:MAG TPA: hypothetical protein VHW09_02460 [Bryobacteraceae bacterium]|jgi:hypothetical protein|nr:hypothetical protein [Bryobacteraceae bacterium]
MAFSAKETTWYDSSGTSKPEYMSELRNCIIFAIFSWAGLGIFPAFGQTTLNLSTDLVPLGIASSNMTPNQPSLDSRPLLEQGINYANTHNYSEVIADQGSYYFLSLNNPSLHVNLNGVTNLTINLQGSDLYFLSPLATAIGFAGGSNSTLENFTVDYLQLPFTQLLVTNLDTANGRLQFTVPPGWQTPDGLNTILSAQPAVYPTFFIYRDGRPAPGTTHIPVQTPFSANEITVLPSGSTTVADYMAQIRPGDTVVLTLRGTYGLPSTVFIGGGPPAGCNQCTFRNISIYAGGSEGFSMEASQNSLLDHIYVEPRPGTDRLISTMADGISLFMSGPNNTVQHCRLIRTMDDATSIPEWVFALIVAAPTAQSLQVAADGGVELQQGNLSPIPAGSAVAFEGPDGTNLGNATITSEQTLSPANGVAQMLLTFDRALPSGLIGAYLYPTDPALRGGGLRIAQNLYLEPGASNGISVWGPENATIEGNYIWRPHWAGINIFHTLGGGWITSPTVNLTITANVIDSTNLVFDEGGGQFGGIYSMGWYGADFLPMVTSPNQNLTVSDNFVADPARSAVWIGNTTGGLVTNNYFLNPNNNVGNVGYSQSFETGVTEPVAIENSVNITTANNTIDLTSGRMFVTDVQFNELAAYSPGITYRLNAYGLGSLVSPAITLTDSAGTVWQVAIQNTTAHALDIQIPALAALGGAYFTLTSGSAKYFATLFLDSQDNVPGLNGCLYETSAASASLAGGSTSVPILVVTQAGCSYQVSAGDPFVSVGAGGTGTKVVTVGLALNTGAKRTTTVEVAGQPITFTQFNACDVGNFGTVNVADVQMMANQALGRSTAINDLNADGSVTVADVQIVIAAALGQACGAS